MFQEQEPNQSVWGALSSWELEILYVRQILYLVIP